MKSGQTFVKICGITRLADARVVVRAGANAIGFVFAPSPRRVSATKAASIGAHIHPAVRKFGVFVNASVDKMLEVIEHSNVDAVQLQGDESADVIAALKDRFPSLFISKVVNPVNARAMKTGSEFPADAIFFDPKNVKDPTALVKPISAALLRASTRPDYVVSGGLDPTNVGRLVRKLHPWGVDVSSGVEVEPGKKDPDKVRAFVRAVRQAEVAS
ncbi:MAG: phosphoribosylanthranilate isomerase [Actinomycetota bacterium]|nr:phosphoribosylanthranilate isomerase [Actinomycetota bacterium]